jgi:hypothetical protein
MTATGLEVFDDTHHKTNTWLKEIAQELSVDRHGADSVGHSTSSARLLTIRANLSHKAHPVRSRLAAAARQHQTRKGEHTQVCKWIPAMNSRPSILRPPNGKAGGIYTC